MASCRFDSPRSQFFWFLGFLEIINGGVHVKASISIYGFNGDGCVKVPASI